MNPTTTISVESAEPAAALAFSIAPFLNVDAVTKWRHLLYRLSCYEFLRPRHAVVDAEPPPAPTQPSKFETLSQELGLSTSLSIHTNVRHFVYPFTQSLQNLAGASNWAPHTSHVSKPCLQRVAETMRATVWYIDHALVTLGDLETRDPVGHASVLSNVVSWSLARMQRSAGRDMSGFPAWDHNINMALARLSVAASPDARLVVSDPDAMDVDYGGQRNALPVGRFHAIESSGLTTFIEHMGIGAVEPEQQQDDDEEEEEEEARFASACLPALPWRKRTTAGESSWTLDLFKLLCLAWEHVFDAWALQTVAPYARLAESASEVLNCFPAPETLVIGTEFALEYKSETHARRRAAIASFGKVVKTWLGLSADAPPMPDLLANLYRVGMGFSVSRVVTGSNGGSSDSSENAVTIHRRRNVLDSAIETTTFAALWLPPCIRGLLARISTLRNNERLFVATFLGRAYGACEEPWTTDLKRLLDHLAMKSVFNADDFKDISTGGSDPKNRWPQMMATFQKNNKTWAEGKRNEYIKGCRLLVKTAVDKWTIEMNGYDDTTDGLPFCPLTMDMLERKELAVDLEDYKHKSMHACTKDSGLLASGNWTGPLEHWLTLARWEESKLAQ